MGRYLEPATLVTMILGEEFSLFLFHNVSCKVGSAETRQYPNETTFLLVLLQLNWEISMEWNNNA